MPRLKQAQCSRAYLDCFLDDYEAEPDGAFADPYARGDNHVSESYLAERVWYETAHDQNATTVFARRDWREVESRIDHVRAEHETGSLWMNIRFYQRRFQLNCLRRHYG